MIATLLGLILVFLILSVICSAIQELIANLLSLRARSLEAVLASMLDDRERTKLVDRLYSHPLIRGLSPTGRPSYIPPTLFGAAVQDIVAGEGVMRAAQTVPALTILWQQAGGDIAAFRGSVEEWFDDCMERASGWYKRRAQWMMLALGMILAVSLNIDTPRIAYELMRLSPADQQAIIARAESIAAGQKLPDPSLQVLEGLTIPFGWSQPGFSIGGSLPRGSLDWGAAWSAAILGWALTAVAVSWGSQFWFDLLIRFVNIRAAGRKPKVDKKDQ
ncbi:hypothetical protein KXR53_18150 [Inquilinus limosus]|uniref:hypothetical protein n=1 Tax=Inquilinus limosus TaxID=171674 RepID=UPI003F13AAD7